MRMVVSSGRTPEVSDQRTGAPIQPRRAEPALAKARGLHAGVTEIVEELHTVNSQHHGQRIGPAALAGLGVHGPDSLLRTLPGDQNLHPFLEQLPVGLALLAVKFQFGNCRLVYHNLPPTGISLSSSTMSHRRRLVQKVPKSHYGSAPPDNQCGAKIAPGRHEGSSRPEQHRPRK